jgi:hypothetical protein
MYDPAIGRFTSVDPIAEKFAFVSGFNYAENKPINSIDLHGLQSYTMISYAQQAEAMYPERAKGLAERTRNYESASGAGAVAGAAIWASAAAVANYGWRAIGSFFLNEVKDEVASQVSGGATDVLDATKMGAKLMKEGFSTIYRAVSKGELADISDNGIIRPGPNSMETKLFTENVDDAIYQGTETGKAFDVISVDVPSSTMNNLGVNTTIDKHIGGMSGNTIYVDYDKLDLLNSTRGKVSKLKID